MATQTPEQRAAAQRAADELGIALPAQGTVSTPGNASTPTPAATAPNVNLPQVQTPAFIEQLTNRLIGQSGIVSSLNTDLENTFAQAAEGINTAADANTARVESAFNREIDFNRQRGDQAFQSAVEGQRGFATQRTALISLEEETQKNLKDLEQRKQELILQGESAAASQLAQLQVDSIKTKIDAQKTFFNQLLQSSEFAQSQFNADRQFGQQQFENAFNVAKFGAEFNEGVRQFETNRQFQIDQFQEGQRQFGLNYALDQEQFTAQQDQREADNAFREQEFAQTLREFEQTKRLTDAQLSKIYYDMTPKFTNDSIVFPSLGEGGSDSKFTPNGKLSVNDQTSVDSAMRAIDFINRAEAAYITAVGGDEQNKYGALSGPGSRFAGLLRTAGSTSGTQVEWSNYLRLLQSRQAFIAKELGGEVGNLAQQEQANAMKRFPDQFGSPEEAEFAFQQARQDVINSINNLGSFDSTSSVGSGGGVTSGGVKFTILPD